jgi:hypothetical protein
MRLGGLADLVDRLLEDVPPPIRPVLEAAAIFRWLNKDLLRAALEQPGIEAVYNELRRFPFVRRRAEGLTLRDTIRDVTSSNVIGAPRPDTIFPQPEGVTLLEAEQRGRDREPGDGSSQPTLSQRLDSTP